MLAQRLLLLLGLYGVACAPAAPPAGLAVGEDVGTHADVAPNDAGALPDLGEAPDGQARDSETDAALDAAPRDAGGSDQGTISCVESTECNDGLPQTEDLCLAGECWGIECSAATAPTRCDDQDPLTDDRCEPNLEARQLRCANPLQPQRCHDANDCADQDACTVEACDATQVCRSSWPPSCAYQVRPFPSCSASVVEGGACEVAVDPSDCSLPSADPTCPQRARCFAGRWMIVHAAGPSCPGPCPATPSAPPGSCGVTALGYGCDYSPNDTLVELISELGPVSNDELGDGHDPPEGPNCRCSPEGDWSCREDSCPLTPPADGAPLLRTNFTSPFVVCEYRGSRCTSLVPEETWRCVVPTPCPTPAPGSGQVCLRATHDRCYYERWDETQPADSYAGECLCQNGDHWSCEPSASSACPANEPQDGAACSPEPGNLRCIYFHVGGDGQTLRRLCQCQTPPFLPSTWECSE